MERDKPIGQLGWLDRRFTQDGKPLCDWYQACCSYDVRSQVVDLLREHPASAPRMEGYGTKANLETVGGVVMVVGLLSMLSAADTDQKATVAISARPWRPTTAASPASPRWPCRPTPARSAVPTATCAASPV